MRQNQRVEQTFTDKYGQLRTLNACCFSMGAIDVKLQNFSFCSEDVPPSHKATEDRGKRCEYP